MALQSSGQISMSDIVAEKGATAGSSADNISLHGLSVDGVLSSRKLTAHDRHSRITQSGGSISNVRILQLGNGNAILFTY